MNLFSKSIETKKADPLAEMISALSDAIHTALKNGVPHSQIRHELEGHAADFRRAEEFRIEQRMRSPLPVMYDAETLKPIDSYGQAQRAEEERIARELREQQRQYAADVDRRAREDARRRGEVL